MSFGSEPPTFGNTTVFLLVVFAIEVAAQRAHGCSGSSRDACMTVSRAGAICTIGKPWRSRWRRNAGRNWLGSVPTTKRIWQRAQARGGTALTGLAGTPDSIARISNEHQANTFSARVSPGSLQFGSILGSLG